MIAQFDPSILSGFAALVSVVATLTVTLIKLGEYRERLRSRGETVTNNDELLAQLEHDLSELEERVELTTTHINSLKTRTRKTRDYAQQMARVTHETTMGDGPCTHPRCPYCSGAAVPAD